MGLTSSSEQAEDRSEVSVQFADDSPAVETQPSHESESASPKLVKALRNEEQPKKTHSQKAAHKRLEALREKQHDSDTDPDMPKMIPMEKHGLSQISNSRVQKEAINPPEEIPISKSSVNRSQMARSSRNGQPFATSSKVDTLTIGTDCSGMEAPLMALENIGVQWKSKFRCDNDADVIMTMKANFESEITYVDLIQRDNRKAPHVDIYILRDSHANHSAQQESNKDSTTKKAEGTYPFTFLIIYQVKDQKFSCWRTSRDWSTSMEADT